VALSIVDMETFQCGVVEMAIPATLTKSKSLGFICTGVNSPIATGVVKLNGSTRYVGAELLKIAGKSVSTVHFVEVDRFSGGQSGSNVANTWYSTTDGLPVQGDWDTRITTPTAVGTSTLNGKGNFKLASLTVVG
jgi:hypothetical protein